MRNLDCLSAEQILSVHAPETLFSNSADKAKKEYRVLALRWHPDHLDTPDAHTVFAHIALLYREALEKQSKGNWFEPAEKIEEETKGIKKFRLESGLIRSVEYYSSVPFELGHMFIGEHGISYEIKNEFTDLFNNARRQIRQLRFKDDAMAVEMSCYLPQIEEAFKTANNTNVMRIRKTPDQIRLADLLSFYAQRLEPVEHIGWILNVLWNIACYLQWSGVTHNAISTENILVSPLRHSGMLIGGWWYAATAGSALLALPDRTLNLMPLDILNSRTADHRSDHELIKATGRELLGDPRGIKLRLDPTVPEPIREWLSLPADQNAVINYREWKHEVLLDSFGPPAFVPMNLTRQDIYKEI